MKWSKANELKCPACEKIGKFRQHSDVDWYTGSHTIMICECGAHAILDVPKFRLSDYTRDFIEINNISSFEIENASDKFIYGLYCKV